MPSRPWDLLKSAAAQLPALLTLMAIVGLAWWGHAHDWQLAPPTHSEGEPSAGPDWAVEAWLDSRTRAAAPREQARQEAARTAERDARLRGDIPPYPF